MAANINDILATDSAERIFISGRLPGKPAEYESCTLVKARLSLKSGYVDLPEWIPHRVCSFTIAADLQLTGPYDATLEVWISQNNLDFLQERGLFDSVLILQQTQAAIIEISKQRNKQALERIEDPKLPAHIRDVSARLDGLQSWLRYQMPCVLYKSGPNRTIFSAAAQKDLHSFFPQSIDHCYVPVDLLSAFETLIHHSVDAMILSRSILFQFIANGHHQIRQELMRMDDRIQLYIPGSKRYEVFAVPYDIAPTIATHLAVHADEKMAMCLSDPLLNQTMTDYRWFIEDIFGKETDESLAVSLIRQGRVSPSPKNEPNLLHRAAEKGWNRLASLLLEAPYSFSVNEIDKDHHATALFYAAANGHYSVVKTLIAKGADSNKTSTCMHETPLFAAAKHGHTRVVCTLIDKGGANPDAGTLLMTPLTIAVGLKHQSVVECLLARHADVRLASHNGSEMPFFAATQSTADIFDLIVRHGGAEVPPLAAGGDPTIVREMILSLDNQGKVTNSKLVVINPRTRSECSIKSDYKRFPLSRSYEPAQVSNLISNGSYEELYFCKAELVGNLKGISDPGIKYRMELIIGRKSDKELLVITPWQNACLAGNYALLDRMQAPADMNQDLVRRLQRWLSNSASSGVSSALNETARKALEDTLFLYRYHGEYLKQIQAPESICKCFRSTDNAELKGLLSLCFEQFQTGTSHDKTLAPSWSHVPSFR